MVLIIILRIETTVIIVFDFYLQQMWCPPTPPTTDNDVYIDYSLGFLYENTPMSEAQLPPIYVKKEQKRSRTDTGINERDGKNINIFLFLKMLVV